MGGCSGGSIGQGSIWVDSPDSEPWAPVFAPEARVAQLERDLEQRRSADCLTTADLGAALRRAELAERRAEALEARGRELEAKNRELEATRSGATHRGRHTCMSPAQAVQGWRTVVWLAEVPGAIGRRSPCEVGAGQAAGGRRAPCTAGAGQVAPAQAM